MLTSQDFLNEIEKEFTTEYLVRYVTDIFEGSLNALMSNIKTTEYKRLDFAKKKGSYMISSVYIMNRKAFEAVKKEFEQRGFKVEFGPASGISLILEKK